MPPAGVELATFSLGRSYSIQLSYGGVSMYILASLASASKFRLLTYIVSPQKVWLWPTAGRPAERMCLPSAAANAKHMLPQSCPFIYNTDSHKEGL